MRGDYIKVLYIKQNIQGWTVPEDPPAGPGYDPMMSFI